MKKTWHEHEIDAELRALAADGRDAFSVPDVTPALLARTRSRFGKAGDRRRARSLAVSFSCLLLVVLLPATVLRANDEPLTLHGIRVTISQLSPAEWIRNGFQGWLASPGAPTFLSPEETADTAPFPIRTPSWLPPGYTADSAPIGAYGNVHSGGKWRVSEDEAHFFVSQSFRLETELESASLGVLQQLGPERGREQTLPPDTEIIDVAGHPAFFRADVPLARADAAAERRAATGKLPEIVETKNQLTVWVHEENGRITDITLFGDLSPSELIKVAESLFD